MKPPPPPKHGVGSSDDDNKGFSVSAAKALFEAAKKPEVRNAAIAAAKNPYVRATAKNVASNEQARNAVAAAVVNPSDANKFSAAASVYRANNAPPPPPPHRGDSSSAASDNRTNGRPVASSHQSIISKLENLHMGGMAPSTSLQVSTSNNYSAQPARPPAPSSSTPWSSTAGKSTGTYVSPNEPHAKVKYGFTSTQADELMCNEGDIIVLKRHVDDQWIYGMNSTTGKHGIVPMSYLDVVVQLPTATSMSTPSAPTYQPFSSASSSTSKYATALYDYNSSTPGDLQFRANDQIFITKQINSDWYEGELFGNRGIFPANFVNFAGAGAAPPPKTLSLASTSPSIGSTGYRETVTAAFDYYSGVATDLHFKQGDVIVVLQKIDNDWIMGELNDAQGLVPTTFLVSATSSPRKSPGLASLSASFKTKKAQAIADYHSDNPQHLYVTRGDVVIVVEDVDEYYYKGKIEAFKTLPSGIFPKNIVQLLPD